MLKEQTIYRTLLSNRSQNSSFIPDLDEILQKIGDATNLMQKIDSESHPFVFCWEESAADNFIQDKQMPKLPSHEMQIFCDAA